MFDIPPPENDHDATKLGNKIREWIKHGRIEPGQTKVEEKVDDETIDIDDDDFQKHDKEEKPKKKRGLFGFFKK